MHARHAFKSCMQVTNPITKHTQVHVATIITKTHEMHPIVKFKVTFIK
jgi:hypothetical protein